MKEVNIPTGTNLDHLSKNGIGISAGDKFKDKNRVKLSPEEIAYDIWLFKVGTTRKGEPYARLKGLYHNEIFRQLTWMGFYKRRPEGKRGEEHNSQPFFIRQKGNVIEPVEINYMLDQFKKRRIDTASEIKFEYKERVFKIPPQKLKEIFFRQFHLIFNSTALQNLKEHTAPILKDSPQNAYFLFTNGIYKATATGCFKGDYEASKEKSVWKGHIIDHDFTPDRTPGHFEQFLKNVSGDNEERYKALRTAIGYLCHNYVSPAHGQAVILYDEKPAKKGQPEGGTGKGLIVNAIKQLRNTAKIDGKKFDSSDKFRWQNLTRQTQILWIDDVKTNFEFDTLHSTLTDGWNVEKKREHEFYIKPEDSPKVVIASNTVLTSEGTTNRRRQFIVELSDFYSRHIVKGTEEPIRKEHDCIFFSDDWDASEWNQFYSFMIDCVKLYLERGLLTYQHKNVAANQLLQRTDEDFVEWLAEIKLETGKQYNKKKLFEDFRDTYKGDDSQLKQNTFTKWLKLNASLNNWNVTQSRSNGNSYISFS